MIIKWILNDIDNLTTHLIQVVKQQVLRHCVSYAVTFVSSMSIKKFDLFNFLESFYCHSHSPPQTGMNVLCVSLGLKLLLFVDHQFDDIMTLLITSACSSWWVDARTTDFGRFCQWLVCRIRKPGPGMKVWKLMIWLPVGFRQICSKIAEPDTIAHQYEGYKAIIKSRGSR